ncbi:MAG: Z1 domain-containing protein [Prevotella sp.]|nr:Z1 domain-containing protein [Prevotella sp.]
MASIKDQNIITAVNQATMIYPDVDKDLLKNSLLANYATQIDDFKILEGRERRMPWLKEFKADQRTDWDFWTRYVKYLKKDKHFPDAVIAHLDNLTDEVLDHLFNPQMENVQIDKKGLVVGQVQSGKTANYIGLICKAADAGFNFIIVLAGIHNNLRSQTQTRLDEGFLGFDTQYVRKYEEGLSQKIGVGCYKGFKHAIANSITTSEDKGDFTQGRADSLGINFDTPTPFLLVVKKNVSVLKRLYAWLHTHAGNGKITTKSLLVIDDEADNASINTNKKEFDPTKINQHIRQIIAQFAKSAYVGYTATPFANIFIPLADDDLFPRDFIINLPAPDNYIGPEKVFGTSVIPDKSNDDLLPIVKTITDYAGFIPEKHKKNDPLPSYDQIPDSLRTAIKCFIITCAIRMARGQGNKHNSMLIHVTRFQVWQNAVKELVEKLFGYYKSEIEANDTTVMEELRCIFEEDLPDYKSYVTVSREILESSQKNIDKLIKIHTWDEIRPYLFKAVQKIEVKSINGSSGDVLTYYEHEETGVSVIAIGGDKLSRGLTLEGLSVSYFLRASKMYDTLMQMGRWFGYRPGYVDLCRLFTSPELNGWFRHITMASEELRAEFNYLAEARSTPDKYALKVRSHPGCLQITSLSKMRYTKNVQVSWASRLVETYQLHMDSQVRANNLRYTNDLINGLGSPERPEGHESCFLWKGVSPEDICDYFHKFKVGKQLVKVNFDLLCEYIEMLNNVGELTNWSVALMSRSICERDSKYTFAEKYTANCFYRNNATDTQAGMTPDTYYIRKNHIVGDRTDEFLDLTQGLLEKALEKTKERKKGSKKTWKENYPSPDIVREEFRPKEQPLLMIYPLNPRGADPSLPDNGEPFVGLVIAFPNTTRTDIAYDYVQNPVGDYLEEEELFDETNDNTYDNE